MRYVLTVCVHACVCCGSGGAGGGGGIASKFKTAADEDIELTVLGCRLTY